MSGGHVGWWQPVPQPEVVPRRPRAGNQQHQHPGSSKKQKYTSRAVIHSITNELEHSEGQQILMAGMYQVSNVDTSKAHRLTIERYSIL